MCSLVFLFWSSAALAQSGQRYAQPVFDDVTTTTGIAFSSALREGASEPTTLYLDFYEPTGDTLSARPLVITVFGGAFVTGSRDFVDMVEYCTRLAKHGYVTASIDYRLLSIWQLTHTAVIRDGYMAAQDVSSAVRFFKAHGEDYRIDTTRIFLLGNSAGSIAILTEMFLSEDERPAETYQAPDLGSLHASGFPEYAGFSPRVAGAIPQWGGVTDLAFIDAEEYAPLCMIHGTDDTTVPIDSGYCFASYGSILSLYIYGSQAIASRLNQLGIQDLEFHPFEGEGHAFYLNAQYQLDDEKFDACFGITRDFLLGHLNLPLAIPEPSARQLSVYPNPATESITLDGDNLPQGESIQLRISNAFGQTLVSKEAVNPSTTIDISNWPSGIYMLQIKNDGLLYSCKFVKR